MKITLFNKVSISIQISNAKNMLWTIFDRKDGTAYTPYFSFMKVNHSDDKGVMFIFFMFMIIAALDKKGKK